MNRTTVVAVVAAAVVGIGGGTASAVLRGDQPAGGALPPHRSTSSATPSTSPSASPSAGPTDQPSGTTSPSASPSSAPPTPEATQTETNEPLLYVGGGLIHHGAGTTPFTREGHVTQVARVGDGFLVSTLVPSEDTTVDLWSVDVQGTSRRLAVVPRWDVDTSGSRVTAYDVGAGQVRVWDLPSRKVVARYATEGRARLSPAFAGHDVLIAQDTGERIDLVRWNPDTGRSSVVGTGYDDQSLSPGGSYLAGSVGRDGLSAGQSGGANGCLHVESTFLKQHHVDWSTCDWRILDGTARFSPDGTRLIAIPADTDGFGPTEIGIFDASDGPRTMVGSFRTPARTLGAQWADNDHLYVYGSTTDDPGSGGGWIRRCDLEGQCTTVVRSAAQLIVGSGT